ncbi:MAG: methylated-DNA--[protein]-cysteine S-methyltransferase [Dialister sp.]|nr:methylated-DNA--[protein]-cysteine S-methyltransferase [Dialister sp.]
MYFPYGEKEISYLCEKDKKLAAVIEIIGPIQRTVYPDLFSGLVKTIIGQQISSQAQKTVWQRLKTHFGAVTPETLATADIEELRSMGIPRKKAEVIRGLAEKIGTGAFDMESLKTLPDEEAIQRLTALDGIGRWTAEMILLFTLIRPDILSGGDFGILRGMRMVYRHQKIDKKLFNRCKKRLSPYGSTASLYFWAVAGGAVPGLSDPAETKQKSATEKEYIATYRSPLGPMTMASNGSALTGLWFNGQDLDRAILAERAEEKALPVFEETKRWLDTYFSGKAPDFTPKLAPKGTAFRKAIWRRLLKIPYGTVVTYGELAKSAAREKPTSPRAVGGATGHNPISLIIPCHRVIGAQSKLIGYAGGLPRKIALLQLEGIDVEKFR